VGWGWPGLEPRKALRWYVAWLQDSSSPRSRSSQARDPASAHDCVNTQRAGKGGIVGTYDVATDTFTPSGAKGNPAFVKIVLPDGSSTYLFVHSGGPANDGVVPGAKNCDGKGLDLLSLCFGS